MTHAWDGQYFLFGDAAPVLLGAEPLIVDLFAGGGGASDGIRQALKRSPHVAINHNEHAIAMHALNHPDTAHFCTDVFDVKTRQHLPPGSIGLLWASPDCRHHSRAKGGKPVNKKIRGLAWVTLKVARERAPEVIIVENVGEFLEWGPLGADGRPIEARAGEHFRKWVRGHERLGYVVDWRVLCAADYGAPTSRRRLFVIMRRDGRPIVWPDPTHGPGRAHPWRTAAECIDWTLPMASIFDRERPLVEATERRIAEGIRRYVLEAEAPYLLEVSEAGAILAPYLVQRSYGEREGQRPRALDIGKPLGTVVAGGVKHALVAAFLQKHNGKTVGQPLTSPLSTLVSTNNKSVVAARLEHAGGGVEGAQVVAAFLSKYYSSGGPGQTLDKPLGTVVTKDRFALVAVTIGGEPYVVTDVLFRMLEPHELAKAQGFGPGYKLTGTKTQKVERIGNSVCPPLARAIVAANVAPYVRPAKPARAARRAKEVA